MEDAMMGSGSTIPTTRRASMNRCQAADAALKANRDTRSLDVCREACHGVDIVLHQAALGSVSRSIVERTIADVV